MKFEEAQKIKEKYLLLENYRAKSEVVSNVLHNIDVFSIEEDSDEKVRFCQLPAHYERCHQPGFHL